jgi:hypothetical protein
MYSEVSIYFIVSIIKADVIHYSRNTSFLALVAPACNPGYLEYRDQENSYSRPARANSA